MHTQRNRSSEQRKYRNTIRRGVRKKTRQKKKRYEQKEQKDFYECRLDTGDGRRRLRVDDHGGYGPR